MNLHLLLGEIGGLFPGRVRFYRKVDSTKEVAARMVSGGHWTDSLILADYQTAGKGTHGRAWHAPPKGCLLVSMLLRPRSGMESVDLARPLADAIMEGIRKTTGLDPAWKEPNDVLLDGKKVAGVLVESTHSPGGPESWVLSFGLNVAVAEFPEELRGHAAAISDYVTPAPPRETILAAILRELRFLLDAPVR